VPLRYFVWVAFTSQESSNPSALRKSALLRSNPSAETEAKTEEGDYCCPLLTSSGLVLKR
jgi:hypothetical protein